MLASAPAPSGSGRRVLLSAAASAVLYAALAAAGDLRGRPVLLFGCYFILWVLALGAYRSLRGRGEAGVPVVVGAAVLFRLLASAGAPALSDDVYRYVWDGRIQLRGIHPYRFPPSAPELERDRDELWSKMNHREIPTIYPPLSQALFAALAALGAGPRGFALAMGALDIVTVLLLDRLLRERGFPRERLVLYAWNPLAVLETAGSGHNDPLAVAFVLGFLSAWIRGRRATAAALFGLSLQAKLFPAILLPAVLRRMRGREIAVSVLAAGVVVAPYALTGPVLPGGVGPYLRHWEGNSVLFEPLRDLLERVGPAPALKEGIGRLEKALPGLPVPWGFLYRHVWPADLARAIAFALIALWGVVVSFRPGLDPVREAYLAIAGLLLLWPTFKPWYGLWLLPLAALYGSRGWLLLGALLPLSYLPTSGPVAGLVRLGEFGPPLLLLAWDAVRVSRRRDRFC